MQVEKWDASRWGEFSEESLRKKLEEDGYSVSRYVYPPRTVFPDHSHSIDKKDAVISGKMMIEIEGRPYLLEAGDTLSVPAGVVHSAKVVGSQPVVSLDATRNPRIA